MVVCVYHAKVFKPVFFKGVPTMELAAVMHDLYRILNFTLTEFVEN